MKNGGAMKKVEGSFTIEAALIMPLVLFVFTIAIHAAILLWEETKETALEITAAEQQDAIEVIYHLELLKNMLGEMSGD